MEVLQSNQRRAGFGRKPAMVPFRHSKLTEMFQNYFIGDGRAVSLYPLRVSFHASPASDIRPISSRSR